ncbi:MAG: cellulose synthase catalytic subunit [Gemmataceae bacterium]|nr:cellulose synthase catalytic subunit [Gemmataceae bacterium]
MLSHEAVLVNLLLLAGLCLFAWEAPARRTWARLAAVSLLLGLTGWYALWRWQQTLPGLEWTFAPLWPWSFFAAEMAVTAYEAWSFFVLVRLTDHSPRADLHESRLRQEPALPSVDVFIPTYNEPREVLEATLRGALALDYGGLVRVWVLDDGGRPWLRELCAERGAGYLARPTNGHAKAGNLNHAFARTGGELILVIDADFVLRPGFLYRTAGFLLYEEGIALVQTPQRFKNPDPIQHNLHGTRSWTEEQHFFMTVAQSARDAWDNAFCVGSGWLVKRSAAEALGGFPQESLCEDLEISYALRGRGQRTLFLNEPLAFGLAPESLPEYVKQRVRWCSGTMQHAWLATGPFRARGLSLLDRLFYLETLAFWFTYPFVVLVLLAPLVFWYTGVSALAASGDDALLVILPRFAAVWVLTWWLSLKKVLPPIAMIHKALPAFHLTAAILKALWRPFGAPFKVTAKGEARDRVVIQWGFLWIFLALGAALLFGMWMNLSGLNEVVPVGASTALDVFWSGYVLLVCLLCGLACIELPRPKDAPQGEAVRAEPLAALRAVLGRLFA